jgi:hypothetical protein
MGEETKGEGNKRQTQRTANKEGQDGSSALLASTDQRTTLDWSKSKTPTRKPRRESMQKISARFKLRYKTMD